MDNQMNRRDAAKTLGVLGTGILGISTSIAQDKAAKESPMRVIDTHQHLWDIEKFKLPWLPKDGPLARSFGLDDYRKATEGLGVSRTVYMEVDVDESQQLAEAELVSGYCSDPATRMAGAVISGRPASPGFGDYVNTVSKLPGIKGIRQVLHVPTTPSGFCLEKAFVEGIRLLGKKGLSYDLCVKHTELGNVAKLVGLCPDTQFILDHCGNPDLKDKDHDSWKKGLETVAKLPNVVVKVSGFLASAPGFGKWDLAQITPIVNHTIDTFGPDRAMFAGDWPVVLLGATYTQWLGAVREIVSSRPKDDQRKLFEANAIKVYRLAP